MKATLTALTVALFALGATAAHAVGGCHSACADGFTYSSEQGKCVKKTVSS